ncbi:carboxypeptidase-like regulatory domain-containing protein [Aurantiacibacter xanthus]|nr:carboxypeptidase-like regulatory domain-containing protein [Aurantiacibacter xanthus]
MRFGLCLVAAVLAAAPGAAFAGELSGSVIDARGLPVAGIAVSLGDSERTTQTDAEGRYAFVDVAAGEAIIAVHKPNGDVQRAFADVAAEGVTRRDVFLVSAGALSALLAPAQPKAESEVDLGETLRLADRMVDAVRGKTAAWRWNDREA